MRTPATILLASALSLAFIGCGGGDPGPKPLRYHFDDMYIASVPLSEKQQMITAQNSYAVAKQERMKAEADLREAGADLDVAKNALKQAELDRKTAERRKQAAEESGDMNRVAAVQTELRAAEAAERAAKQKVEWIKAKRKYLEKYMRWRTEDMYAKEAKFELAKARVAKDANIRPQGFTYEDFQNQASERSRRSQKYEKYAKDERERADQVRKEWLAMEQQAKELNKGGATSSAESPN